MTRAVIYRGASGRLIGFSIKGHSGYSEAGTDIVCAGASILGSTCINALESVAGIVPIIDCPLDEPRQEAMLPFPLDEARDHDAQVLFKALRQGFSDLAEAYPQYFHLSIQERRETP